MRAEPSITLCPACVHVRRVTVQGVVVLLVFAIAAALLAYASYHRALSAAAAACARTHDPASCNDAAHETLNLLPRSSLALLALTSPLLVVSALGVLVTGLRKSPGARPPRPSPDGAHYRETAITTSVPCPLHAPPR